MGNARKIEWWPIHAADEMMPPGLESPSEFIFEKGGELFVGYRDDAELVTDAERGFINRKIAAGDIVGFIRCEALGSVEVEIKEDGTSSVITGTVNERATHFWNGDTLADSMPEFVEVVRQCHGASDFPLRQAVRMAWWSDEEPHKLVHTAEGWRFAPVSKAEARQ